MKYIVGTYVTILIIIFPSEALALVNINTATSEELQTLNGIGPTYASRIVEARPFSSIEDIKNVNGIGEATYEKIKNDITVSGTTQTSPEDTSSNATPNTDTAKSSTSDKKEYKPVNGLVMDIPDIGYVNQPIEFDVEPADGTNNRLVRYSWNFGDGKVADIKSPVHTYKFPGTYLVVVESYYLKNTKMVRKQLTILAVNISLSKNIEGDVSLTNEGQEEIDIGGMSLGYDKSFVFPNHTIILPGSSITISKEEIIQRVGDVALYDQAGKVVTVTQQAENNFKFSSNNIVAAQALIGDLNTKKDEVINATPTPVGQVDNSASVSNSITVEDKAKFPPATLPYFGLFGIISLGLLIIYSKHI